MTTERNTIQNILNEQAVQAAPVAPGPATPMQDNKELDYIMNELGINRDQAMQYVQYHQSRGNNPSREALRDKRQTTMQQIERDAATPFTPEYDRAQRILDTTGNYATLQRQVRGDQDAFDRKYGTDGTQSVDAMFNARTGEFNPVAGTKAALTSVLPIGLPGRIARALPLGRFTPGFRGGAGAATSAGRGAATTTARETGETAATTAARETGETAATTAARETGETAATTAARETGETAATTAARETGETAATTAAGPRSGRVRPQAGVEKLDDTAKAAGNTVSKVDGDIPLEPGTGVGTVSNQGGVVAKRPTPAPPVADDAAAAVAKETGETATKAPVTSGPGTRQTAGGGREVVTRTGPFGLGRQTAVAYGDDAGRLSRSTPDMAPGAGTAARETGEAGARTAARETGEAGARTAARETGEAGARTAARETGEAGARSGRRGVLGRLVTGGLAGLGLDQLLRGTGAYDALGNAFDRGRDFLTGVITGDPNQDPNATGGGAGGGAGSGDPRGTGSEYDVTQGASTAMALADAEIARVAERNLMRKGYKGPPSGINKATIDRIRRKYANQEAVRQRDAGAIPGMQAPPARLGGQEARSTHTPVPIRPDASPEERQRIASHNLRMAARSRNEAEFGTPTPSQQELAGRSQRIRNNTQAQRDRATAIALGLPIQGPEGQGVLQRVTNAVTSRANAGLDRATAGEIAGGTPPARQGGTGTQVDPNAAPPAISNTEIPDGRGGTTTTTGAGMASIPPNASGTTNNTQGGTQQSTGTNRSGGSTQQATGTGTTTTNNTQGGNPNRGTGRNARGETGDEEVARRRAAREEMRRKREEEARKKAEADAAAARQNQGTSQATSGTTS